MFGWGEGDKSVIQESEKEICFNFFSLDVSVNLFFSSFQKPIIVIVIIIILITIIIVKRQKYNKVQFGLNKKKKKRKKKKEKEKKRNIFTSFIFKDTFCTFFFS